MSLPNDLKACLTPSSSFLVALPLFSLPLQCRRIILSSKKLTREIYVVIDALPICTSVKACTFDNSTRKGRQESKRLKKI
jgi:hypothetical protein